MPKERSQCKKYGGFHFCDLHHILPQGLFGKGETVPLCKNCHDEYHRFLGFKYLLLENKKPEEWYLMKWYTWFYTMCVLVVLLIGLAFV